MAGSVWVDVLRDLQLEAVEDPGMFADDAEYVYLGSRNKLTVHCEFET
jgi:hypothetical protein